jgi:hypothetical protein
MSNIKYEAVIGGYTFLMKDDNVIEVWAELDAEYPESFIYLREGNVLTRKDFEIEIMDFILKN